MHLVSAAEKGRAVTDFQHDGIIGVITSPRFLGMDTLDRQSLIGDLIESHLSPEDRRRAQVIVGVTPDEGTGYFGKHRIAIAWPLQDRD